MAPAGRDRQGRHIESGWAAAGRRSHRVRLRLPAAIAASQAVGHLHRFSLRDIRQLVADACWHIEGEVLDPLPLAVHAFDRMTPHAIGNRQSAIRLGLASVHPFGERLVTLHFAVLAMP